MDKNDLFYDCRTDQTLGGTIKDENKIEFFVQSMKTPIIELKANGDIFVKGKLIENDKEVVDGMRQLLGITVHAVSETEDKR